MAVESVSKSCIAWAFLVFESFSWSTIMMYLLMVKTCYEGIQRRCFLHKDDIIFL